jgi:cytochrome b pre-mRNA-processing protein 3
MNRVMRFLGLAKSGNQAIVDSLFQTIVAAARQPKLYANYGVPDSPLGRFEMMSLHMGLILRAARDTTGAVAEITQELTEEFFTDVDHSLRELGIGDSGVPKRMKKLASMFYGRVDAYARAIDAQDLPELALALRRNVTPDGVAGAEKLDAEGLARYVLGAAKAAEASMASGYREGRLSFEANP